MARLTYLGHAAFQLEAGGRKILVDPWLSNPKSPVKPEEVEGVDLIVITHSHFDHLGDVGKIAAKNPGAKVLAVYEVADLAAEEIAKETGASKDELFNAGRVIGANIGGPVVLQDLGLKVAFTPATHSSVGVAAGAVIITGEGRVYHAGDTGVTMDMRLVGEIYKPHVALLPIGGHFTMDPVEAAKAVELIRPLVAIPMHYGTFPVLYGDPEEFKKRVEEKCLPTQVRILKPGESYEFDFSKA
ncbi:conserved hypothetical protein [Aeropyrum pernix K1]|uniref:UPF0173 metal-dependent hydrolase APE_1117 n=1 Tax=Aeropyrum pernix (strain ATCC 700893 / DSM 11879 / JCM 9820 / NBRC 100138 / K1) TaxID=272557 RepID=Y1117_AERPE|nr:metal-dependent hydrolase [Aeropyrum pernix]Q9YCZ5.1 RecName: Full=UPF0173 metal-dependent hydrolase APE_1117 [Aeropyrum pernix K1]BAA80102.1 conserved hypothetical protein [Aeropyrum pernix K1]